jgi:CubicO group peptidase (beta-lactamase class C family)
MKLLAPLLLIATIAKAGPLPSASPESVDMSPARLKRIVPIMQGYVDRGEVSGISTAVIRHGKIVHMESVGLRDIERKLPMTRDTIFRIYSMTKPVTSVAVMILYEEGKVELTDPISKYLPQFEGMKVYVSGAGDSVVLEDANPVPTIHDLLKHTSGLGYSFGGKTVVHSLYRAAKLWDKTLTLDQFVGKLADLPLWHQPGTKWKYGRSTDVLGLLVQVVSGQQFERFLKERIFTPLEMVDTDFWVPADKLDRFANIYRWTDDQTLQPFNEGDPPPFTLPTKNPQGGSGLVSTVDDYLRFCQMLLNGGVLNEQRILMPATARFMLMDHLIPDQETAPGIGFGLGFSIVRNPARAGRMGSVGEAYWGGLANTHFWIDPKEDLVYMVWTQLFRAKALGFILQMNPLVHATLLK